MPGNLFANQVSKTVPSQAIETDRRSSGGLACRTCILFLIIVLSAACRPIVSLSAEYRPDDRRPNIIFILADDLGYTDLGCYGSEYYETPHIDRMAREGMRFTNGYTCGPNCQPTRAALMSGQYMSRTGIYTVGSIERFNWRSRPLKPVDNVDELALEKTTVAEALKQAGYATGMFGKWHLGDDPRYHPLRQGFDEALVSRKRHFDFTTKPKVDYPPGTYLADFLTDESVDFIRRHKEQPFFLYLPHFAVHIPLQAKRELIEKFRSKPPVGGHRNPVYAAMIASLDQSVGRVLDVVEELGLAENTLIIFSSDNGGVGGYRREGIKRNDVTSNKPLRGGKGMLYEGGIRVPYIFCWPGKIEADSTCRQPINSVDLYPTLLAAADIMPNPDYPLDGRSYLDLLLNGCQTTADRWPLFWHFPGYLGDRGDTWRTTPVGVIRSGDWKLLEFFEDGHLELYNLREDIGERHNLADEMPELAEKLQARLHAWREKNNAPMPAVRAEGETNNE